MKKSLIALAIAGSFASVAHAESAVSVYGIVDMGIVSERGNVAGTTQKLTSGAQSGTRLGVKGTEDLSNNLKALFVLETSVKADEGGFNQNGIAFGRQSFVGLQGDFGAVTLGRQYTPYFLTLNNVDPFASGMAGAAINLMATSGLRMNNTVKYALPNIAGFNGEVAYGFGEQTGDSDKSRQIDASIGYDLNPVSIRLAYNNKRNVADTASSRNTLLGATWDFQVAKAFLAFAENEGPESSPYSWIVPGANPATANPYGVVSTSSAKSRDFLIGATVPFGNHTFIASYIRKDDRTAANNDANQIALGYTYALSKRTNLYAAWGRISNKNLASYTVGNNSDPGTGDKAVNIGVRTIF
jgi:predicted porin